jgi:peroxiredoxin
MAGSSATLKIGDRAPDFSLSAANRTQTLALAQLLTRGPAIVEFLRGTW